MKHWSYYKCPEYIMKPWSYTNNLSKKNIRSLLIDAFQPFFCVPEDIAEQIKDIIDCLHTASLMIDDIEDNSIMRRNAASAHMVYGIDNTLNSANYAYFIALDKIQYLPLTNNPVKIFTLEMLNLHRGQGLDIYYRSNNYVNLPDLEEYCQIARDKTGGLFRMAIRLLHSYSGIADDWNVYEDICNNMSVYFQIRDDLLNIASPLFQKSKGFCDDITEGKLSYPVLLSLSQDSELLNILKMKTSSEELKKKAVDIMRSDGSINKTLEYLKELELEIRDSFESIGSSEQTDLLLRILDKLSMDLDDCS